MADIKQIKTSDGSLHNIDATKWNGHTFDEVTNLIHGVVDTYVIPETKSSVSGYSTVVGGTKTIVSTTVGTLKGLVSNPPSNEFDKFNIGDIVLMGATSDGTKNFDRWISEVSGTGDSAVIKLDVLETQVAKHHHTISASGTSKALTGVNKTTETATIPVVGTAVTVLTSAKGTFVTSVEYTDDGENTMAISHASGTGSISHNHTVDSHSHNITPNTLVSRNLPVYYSLTSANYTPHTHTDTTVAGTQVSGDTLTYVTGASTTDTFVKTLKQTSTNTGAASGSTAGSGELTTSAQVSTDTIGEIVKTKSGGTHKHTVTATTTTSVVTAATVQASVVTSAKLTYTAPTVQASVVTSAKLTYTAPTVQTNVVTSWTCSVDGNGILSFNSPSGSQSAGSASLEAPRGSQSAGSASLDAPRASQSRTYGAPTISVTCEDSGSHQHGFSHTHKIATHTHGLNSHTHTYDKASVSVSANAITALSTTTYTLHKHNNVTVAGAQVNDTTPIKYVTGGSTENVVRDLKNTAVATTSAAPGTNTVYTKLTGDITFPGLNAPTGSVSTSTKSINPAAAGTETAIKAITFTSSKFVTGLTSKTSPNIGGE